MRTRTNLHLDEDAIAFASSYASARGITLGVAISELIRRAEQMPCEAVSWSPRLRLDESGFVVVKSTGQRITSERVKEELDDLE